MKKYGILLLSCWVAFAPACKKRSSTSSLGQNDPPTTPTPSTATTSTLSDNVMNDTAIAAPQLRVLRSSETTIEPSRVQVWLGSKSYTMEQQVDTEASLTAGKGSSNSDFRYTLNINSHSTAPDQKSGLYMQFSSLKKSWSNVTPGNYSFNWSEMQSNDLYWSLIFSPDGTQYYELESGDLTISRIKNDYNTQTLSLEGSFEGTAALSDLRPTKSKKTAALSGEFEIHVQHPLLPHIL